MGAPGRVFPPAVVDRAIAEAGRGQQRSRLLPARTVVYYVMGLALFPLSSYEEVMRMLAAAQGWAAGDPDIPSVPTKGALSQARARLGPEVLKALFRAVARPLGTGSDQGFYGADRLRSIDSALIDVPDTPANVEAFGRPSALEGGPVPLPQVRLVGLSGTGSRAILDAVVGRVDQAPRDLGGELRSPGTSAETGATSFTVQDIARRANVSLSTVYTDFSSKDELLVAVLDEAIRVATDRLEVQLAACDDPLDRLRVAIIGPLLYAAGPDRPADVPALSRERDRLGDLFPAEAQAATDQLVDVLRTELAAAARAGLVAPLDPERDATAIYHLWTTELRDLWRADGFDEVGAAADYLWRLCCRFLRIPVESEAPEVGNTAGAGGDPYRGSER